MPFRQYSPELGRWTSIDPVTHYFQSTYSGYDNNPIFWADPSGAVTEQTGGGRLFTGDDAKALFKQLQAQYGILNGGSKDDSEGLAPEDIIIRNKKGEELGRIILPGKDKIVTIDTDLALPEPVVVDPSTDSTRNGSEADAVGISLDISAYMGGGMTFSYDFMYFTEGEDEGNVYWFYSYGGGPGVDGGISGGLALSYYNNEADVKDKNARGYTGHFAGRSIGFGAVGYGKTWSNQDNLKGELWENHKSTRTWKTLNYSAGEGVDFGAKIYWGTTTLMNGGKPIYSADE